MAKRAFPNAYVSTDELPSRSIIRGALCVVAIAGVGYLGLVILVLSLFSTEYNPITQFASDYGVGFFSLEMNSGFLLAGVGTVSLALTMIFSRRRRIQRTGAVLLILSGLALIMNSFFTTDVEGAAKTFHGVVHGVGGAIFFSSAPFGLILISYGFGRKSFLLTLLAFLTAVILLALDTPLALGAAGLTERIIILVTFSSIFLTAIRVYKES